jgi:hypothetical protein
VSSDNSNLWMNSSHLLLLYNLLVYCLTEYFSLVNLYTQVTRSVDTASGQLSSQEQKTVDAIVKAR